MTLVTVENILRFGGFPSAYYYSELGKGNITVTCENDRVPSGWRDIADLLTSYELLGQPAVANVIGCSNCKLLQTYASDSDDKPALSVRVNDTDTGLLLTRLRCPAILAIVQMVESERISKEFANKQIFELATCMKKRESNIA